MTYDNIDYFNRLNRWEGLVELRQLTIFQAVAKTLSFTKAAEQLSYSQSNVTAQIQALEREFGTALTISLSSSCRATIG